MNLSLCRSFVYFLLLFLLEGKHHSLDYLLKGLKNNEKEAFENCFNFIYKDENLSLENLKVLESAFSVDLFFKYRYLRKQDSILFVDDLRRSLYLKNIETKKVSLIKKFKKKLIDFDLNMEGDRIALNFSNSSIYIYIFPKVQFLKKLKGIQGRYDKGSKKLFFLKGRAGLSINQNRDNLEYQIVFGMRTPYSLYFYTEDGEISHLYNGSPVEKYRVLNNSDILVISSHDPNIFERVFKDWRYKYKFFLLSNKKRILKELGSYKRIPLREL